MIGLNSLLLPGGTISPLVVPAERLNPKDFRRLLNEFAVLIVKNACDAGVLRIIENSGLILMRQYETVQQGYPDRFELTTIAKNDGPGITRVSKPGSTKIHQDGYQFDRWYRGVEIAGTGNMPDVEILYYPVVREPRVIFAYGVRAAAHATAEVGVDLGVDLIEALKKPQYRVDVEQYQILDPQLGEPPLFPVIYEDELGSRVQIGGRVSGDAPRGQFALEVFRRYLESKDPHSFKVEAGTAVFFNQRLVAHAGVRPSEDGETVLVRRLARWPR
jgi:hypothetical protein